MSASVTTDANGKREMTTYAIPSTALRLHLTLGLDLPLPIAVIRACLTGAITAARTHESKSLTPSDAPWKFPENFEIIGDKDKAEALSTESGDDVVEARFGIVGDPVFGTHDLTWGDVEAVLTGLESWFEEDGREVEVWFRVVEDGEGGRGNVGSGSLRRGSAVGGKSHKGGVND